MIDTRYRKGYQNRIFYLIPIRPYAKLVLVSSGLIDGRLARPEGAGGCKIATCALGQCLISRLSPKKLQYRNINERCYTGHEFTLQVIVKWLNLTSK